MKIRIMMMMAISALASSVSGQDETQKITQSKIAGVTVFQNGAQVQRTAEIQLPQGRTCLIIPGLSPYFDQESIQVKGEGKFTILSVNPSINYLDPLDESAEVKSLREKIKNLNEKKDMAQAKISLLEKKQALIDANRVFTGSQQTINPEILAQLTSGYMKSAEEIAFGILEHRKKIRETDEEVKKLENQIDELSAKKTEAMGEIRIITEAKESVTANFEISYYTVNASWVPSYDIRVNSVEKPIDIVYKANLQQNTGEDWKNVKLTFSNANPAKPGSLPILKPWYLTFNDPYDYRYRGSRTAKDAMMPNAAISGDYEGFKTEEKEASLPVLVMEQENTTTFEFKIDNPYSIISGNRPVTIDLKTININAGFEYHCIPKLDKTAFLIASLTGWDNLNLLSGESNIYFEGTFVGKSLLDVRNLDDTLRISLGADKNIVITREKLKDYNTRRFFGSNQVVSRAYETGIRNNRNQSIRIVVHDQVPVSSNNDITVEHEDLSGAMLNPESGELTWTLNLSSKEQQKIVLKYSVKYPKEKSLIIE